MKILHAASELYPLIKTGGLADVLGALPFAQAEQGDDVRVVLPYYRQVRQQLPYTAEVARRDIFGGHIVIRYAPYRNIGLYLIDAPHLYGRDGNPYHDAAYHDYHDNVIRFGVLGWAAAAIATGLDELWGRADVLHAHDWQAGLAPAYLYAWSANIASVFTIHNIAYQGCFQAKHLSELWLPESLYRAEGLEFYGQLSFLKAGLYYAGRITTVSPSYAEEITAEPAACGMAGLLAYRHSQGRLGGILNGVDGQVWNPAADTALPETYHADNMQGKTANKAALQQQFGLNPQQNALLAVMVSRLTPQKGADLLLHALQQQLPQYPDLQFILLGSGAPDLEQAFQALAQQYPHQVAAVIGYDEQLAHRLMGGGDLICVPSRFEPCGLTQLYGLKYGTLPLVRHTGGLADTVCHTDSGSLKHNRATGFVFQQPDGDELSQTLESALKLWRQPKQWAKVRQNAMRQDFGWHKAADAYAACYRQMFQAA